MQSVLAAILFYFIFPNVLFYWYNRCFTLPFRWRLGLFYTAFYCLLCGLEGAGILTGVTHFFLEILVLVLCGVFFLRQKKGGTIPPAVLAISVFYLSGGLVQSVGYWLIGKLLLHVPFMAAYLEAASYTAEMILFCITFSAIFHFFSGVVVSTSDFSAGIIVIPLLFLTLIEQTISDFIYGETITWDARMGLISPQVSSFQLIFLHVFAYLSMWAALYAFQKMIQSIHNEQALQILKIQARAQETYVREAQLRYEKTRAFRHDIKNHLLVLNELLISEETEKAKAYLAGLEDVTNTLTPEYAVHTHHVTVDLLLGSKWMVAEENGIQTECEVGIPDGCRIPDIDWCIILSNAVDNAIEANQQIDIRERYLGIFGRQKGNMFSMQINNRCKESPGPPAYGIGLSNIAGIVRKYGGQMEIEQNEGWFKLTILLIL